MSAPVIDEPGAVRIPDTVTALRSRAVSDALRFRALARIALADGMPKGELRAAHARAAARSVLGHARQLSILGETVQTPAADSLCSTIER